MAKIKTNLSISSIDNTIKKLKEIQKKLADAEDGILKDLAEQTKEQIETNYNKLMYTSGSEKPTFAVVKYSKGYKAIARGHSVIYDEFGTGDRGQADGHPWKGDFGLNPYNSGDTIRPANDSSAEHGISSGLYWTYKDESGDIVYTQGIPAGKFMYDADKWLREHYKEIVKKKVDDVLSKV